jgi:hypothetical protein
MLGRSLNLHESPIVKSVTSLSSLKVSAKNVGIILFCGRPSSDEVVVVVRKYYGKVAFKECSLV